MPHLNTHECEHCLFIGVSFDDDNEPTSSGAPPAKKLKISSHSTDTGLHANNGKVTAIV